MIHACIVIMLGRCDIIIMHICYPWYKCMASYFCLQNSACSNLVVWTFYCKNWIKPISVLLYVILCCIQCLWVIVNFALLWQGFSHYHGNKPSMNNFFYRKEYWLINVIGAYLVQIASIIMYLFTDLMKVLLLIMMIIRNMPR